MEYSQMSQRRVPHRVPFLKTAQTAREGQMVSMVEYVKGSCVIGKGGVLGK